MPRLLIISRSHNPLGGADRIIADLCRQLPSRGWETILGLTRGARFDDPDAYRQVHSGLPTVDIDGTLGTRAERLRSLRKVIRQTAPEIVLVMRVFDAIEAVAEAKNRKLEKAPRLALGVRAFEAPYISDVRRYQTNIDLCVTSGNLIAEACQVIGGMEQDRVESIAGGVHSPSDIVNAKELHTPMRLLYAGRLEQQQKRALDLVPFTQALQSDGVNFVLDICGAGPEEETLSKSLKPLIDDGSVRMHGWVEQKDLYERFYPSADCLVHFAAWEGVTISPREAMAHGVVPVISQFTGLHAEGQFLDGINALTFPVACPEEASKRVGELISRPDLMQKLSKSAIDSQTGRYSFEGALDAWRDAFDGCLAREPKRGPFQTVPDRLSGRLSKWGISPSAQSLVRKVLHKPVLHQQPGSEWPTASGLMSEAERMEVAKFAEQLESTKKIESAA